VSKKYPKKRLDGLSFSELRRHVKAGHIDPLYLFVGDEAYYHEHGLRLLYNTLDEAGRLFNLAVFTIGSDITPGRKASAWAALETANQSPMMAARRIVVIRDFDKIKEDETEMVMEYLKRPSPLATVVFQAASLDQRRRLSAALLKTCTVAAFDRLGDEAAKRWAEEFLKSRGCRIEPAALGHLIGLTGTRLMRLANELGKLVAYSGGGAINLTMVQELVPRAREHSSFELWDAIMERDRKRAVRVMERILDDNERDAPLMVLGSLAALFRKMLVGKELMVRGASYEEVGKATGQYGPRAKEFNARISRMAREEIVHGLHRIAQVDSAIKNSEATPRLQMQYLIAELTLPESARWAIFH